MLEIFLNLETSVAASTHGRRLVQLLRDAVSIDVHQLEATFHVTFGPAWGNQWIHTGDPAGFRQRKGPIPVGKRGGRQRHKIATTS